MTRLVLAVTALALAAGIPASAMASHHGAGKSGSHVGRFHTATFARTHHIRRSSGYPGVGSPDYRGGFVDLGPLGMTAACGFYPRGHGYCGPRSGTPIDAWSY
jgi:hypothetical protein